jgi:hypothetical protein
LVLTFIGIGCSIYICLSQHYFSFISLRNDTFYDEDKYQPKPFEYATEANVGLFRYEILDVFEFPWPPKEGRELRLFDDLLEDEVRRLQNATVGDGVNATVDGNATAANATDALLGGNETLVDANATDANATDVNATDVNATDTNTTDVNATDTNATATNATDANATEAAGGNGTVVPPVGPGSNTIQPGPTDPPTMSPTATNPNDLVDASVDIGVVKPYPEGRDQFDSLFGNAQLGAMMAPIFAGIGTIFGLIELCCCTYKCSWLPTALFLYLAFMFQTFTLFLFLSEDFW